jgi:CheY-like chemotaxis protein
MLAIWSAAHSDELLRTFHFAGPCVRMAIWSEVMPNTRKILIVDDDPQLRDALTEQLLLHEEFEAAAAENGTKGVQVAKEGQIDLVIMDVGLPDIDGREAVRILRRKGFKAPIIMLTGHDADSDTILGLESGANDYVTKPFRFAVLLARIRTQLRQHEASEDAIFAIGPYTFWPASKLARTRRRDFVKWSIAHGPLSISTGRDVEGATGVLAWVRRTCGPGPAFHLRASRRGPGANLEPSVRVQSVGPAKVTRIA